MKSCFSRILIVDDDEAFRRLLELSLGQWGHEVLTASNGSEGLKQWHESDGSISTIITDLDMPGMGRFQFVRTVREAGFQGRIVVMSGRLSATELKVVETCGISGFFSKPFDVSMLPR